MLGVGSHSGEGSREDGAGAAGEGGNGKEGKTKIDAGPDAGVRNSLSLLYFLFSFLFFSSSLFFFSSFLVSWVCLLILHSPFVPTPFSLSFSMDSYSYLFLLTLPLTLMLFLLIFPCLLFAVPGFVGDAWMMSH